MRVIQHGVPDAERFETFADRSGGATSCHPWRGARDPNEYGRFRLRHGTVLASRWALAQALGRPLRADEEACHRCDNPPCVNARHLYAGARLDNEHDKLARRGHYNAKKTHCKRGDHPLNGDNLYVIPSSGGRVCRACQRKRSHSAPAK